MLLSILTHYILWHYTTAWRELWHIIRNLAWFLVNFFSLKELSRSLLMPWRRITEERSQRFSLEAFANYIIINALSRLVGAMFRLTVIITGLFALMGLGVMAAGLFIFWLLAPSAILMFMVFGIFLLF